MTGRVIKSGDFKECRSQVTPDDGKNGAKTVLIAGFRVKNGERR